jgi:hypothetical protein
MINQGRTMENDSGDLPYREYFEIKVQTLTL